MRETKYTGTIVGSILLLLAAVIWGFAFVAQSVGMDYVGPYTFLCSRSFVGAAAVGVMLLVKRRLPTVEQKTGAGKTRGRTRRKTLAAGICCGVVLAVASALQQVGMESTEPGKAGFITSMYLLIVPLLGLFAGNKVPGKIWMCVAAAVVGLYLLCMTGDGVAFQTGDLLVGGCALCFAVHILLVDRVGNGVDAITLSLIQFLTAGVLSGVAMLVIEHPTWSQIQGAALPILYAGVLSSGLGYTFQIIGQKTVPPTAACLLMSLESVFSVVGGFLLLHQTMSGRELLGCLILFGAVILAQLPTKEKISGEKRKFNGAGNVFSE